MSDTTDDMEAWADAAADYMDRQYYKQRVHKMGDMADYVNELIEQDYQDLADYRCGRMSHEEAYERGIIDEYGAEYYSYKRPSEPIVCKYCGEKNLTWVETDNGWRLYKNGSIHSCLEYRK